MNTSSKRVWITLGGVVLLVAAFALGYTVGNKNNNSPVEASNKLSSTDMDRAFGNVVPTPETHESVMQEPTVMGLAGLVEGLEKKVAAHPENIDQQLLLAQTYNELESRDKSLKLLHSLNKQAPRNPQVKITFATILMKSEAKQELQEASRLFDEAIKLKPEAASMASMYQGEIRVKLDNISRQ